MEVRNVFASRFSQFREIGNARRLLHYSAAKMTLAVLIALVVNRIWNLLVESISKGP